MCTAHCLILTRVMSWVRHTTTLSFPYRILLIYVLPYLQLVNRLSQENLMAYLSTFLPAVLDAFENHSPYVRKVESTPTLFYRFFFVLQMSSLIRHYLFGHLFLLHFVSSNLPVAKGHRNKGVNYAIKEHNIYELDSALTYKFVNWSLCSFIERFTVRKTLTEL